MGPPPPQLYSFGFVCPRYLLRHFPQPENQLFQQATQHTYRGLLLSCGEVKIKTCDGGIVSSTIVAQVVCHQGAIIASPLVRIAIFLPLGVHPSCQINAFLTPGPPYQTRSALSNSPPSLPVYQLLNSPVCKSHPPTFSILRPRML